MGAGGIGVRFPAVHIELGVAIGSPLLFFRGCVAQALSGGDGPATRYTLGCNTASIMKI